MLIDEQLKKSEWYERMKSDTPRTERLIGDDGFYQKTDDEKNNEVLAAKAKPYSWARASDLNSAVLQEETRPPRYQFDRDGNEISRDGGDERQQRSEVSAREMNEVMKLLYEVADKLRTMDRRIEDIEILLTRFGQRNMPNDELFKMWKDGLRR